MSDSAQHLYQALWRIYNRPDPAIPWTQGGNLPWSEPAFSARMLQEHLDETHGAASRIKAEREQQIEWLWSQLGLQPGQQLLDMTCGPGLYAVEFAKRGITVTGVDFSPASIAYARELAAIEGVNGRCHFFEQDIRQWTAPAAPQFEAAVLLYGQLAVFPKAEAQAILHQAARSLRPGGKLCVELLNQDEVDKTDSNWWFTDNTGLWGETPFLHLGERFWLAAEKLSIEQYRILHLETGQLTEIQLCDQTYAVAEMVEMMHQAGFAAAAAYPAQEILSLYDADEWIVYVAQV